MSPVLQHLLVAAVGIAVVSGSCSKTVPVRCPDVEVVKNFDVVQNFNLNGSDWKRQMRMYLGLWYEIERVPQVFQPNGACVTALYTAQVDPTYPVGVLNRQRDDSTQLYDSLVGGVRVADDAGTTGKLKVKFPVTPVESDYWVLDTDYDNFALVYSCRVLPGGTGIFQSAWVLARENTLTPEVAKSVNSAFRKSGVDRSLLTKTRQDDTCNYDMKAT